MKKRLFVKNAAIMTMTALILRSIGIVFRIYISNRVGAEGMGLYQLILSVYVLVSSFAAAGLNTAVTRLCADKLACNDNCGAKKILRTCLALGILAGILSGALVAIGAEWIADVWINDNRAVPSLRIMTISLPFMGASSCIKGYFLAKRNASSSSAAQILEQLLRIGAIWMLLQLNAYADTEGACFAVLLGDTIAEAGSCIYMAAAYWIDTHRDRHQQIADPQKVSYRSVFGIAAPITAARYVNSGLRTIENMTVPAALTVYCGSRDAALAQFGTLKGMVMPLIFFPSSFLNAVSALLIPELSEAKVLGNDRALRRTVTLTMQVTLQSSFMIAGLFYLLAAPLGNAIYNSTEVGFMLRVLAPLTPVMYLESVVVGMLKGLNQQTPMLLYSIMDSVSRILLIPTLLSRHGMYGMFILMILSNFLTCTLNTLRLLRICKLKPPLYKWLFCPALATIACTLFVDLLHRLPAMHGIDDISCCVLLGGIFCMGYFSLLWLFGGINTADITRFYPIKQKSI